MFEKYKKERRKINFSFQQGCLKRHCKNPLNQTTPVQHTSSSDHHKSPRSSPFIVAQSSRYSSVPTAAISCLSWRLTTRNPPQKIGSFVFFFQRNLLVPRLGRGVNEFYDGFIMDFKKIQHHFSKT